MFVGNAQWRGANAYSQGDKNKLTFRKLSSTTPPNFIGGEGVRGGGCDVVLKQFVRPGRKRDLKSSENVQQPSVFLFPPHASEARGEGQGGGR